MLLGKCVVERRLEPRAEDQRAQSAALVTEAPRDPARTMLFLRSGGALCGRSKLTRRGHHQPEDLEIVCLTQSVLCFLMAGARLTPIALGIRKSPALILQLCRDLRADEASGPPLPPPSR